VEPRDDLKRSLILSADWLYARMWNEEKQRLPLRAVPAV
jgi:hypothetical protein